MNPIAIDPELLAHLERVGAMDKAVAEQLLAAVSNRRTTSVGRAAARLAVSRRTLGRRLDVAGLPAPKEYVRLAKHARAVQVLLAGGTVREAADRSGWADQFTLSNALQRDAGIRPSAVRRTWCDLGPLVDAWAERQRERGKLQGGS